MDHKVTGDSPAASCGGGREGPRRGHGRGREGEGKGGGEVRTLTLSTMEWAARAGEAGRRRGGDRTPVAEAEKKATTTAIAGLPARTVGTGRKRRTRRSGGTPPASSTRRKTAAI